MHQHGFSLVELVVTMVVMLALSAMALPAFQTSIGNAEIRTVAESIGNGLQQSRMEAIKRNARIRFTLQNNSAWQVGCITVTPSCPAVITSKSGAEGASDSVVVSANSNRADFTAFGTRDPANPDGLTSVEVTHSQVKATERRALRVLLAAGGNVRICDPAITTAGDPRAC